MINDLLTLGVGALIGSLITRQYDDLKVRRADCDLLKLVYHEINDFECALLNMPPESMDGRLVTQDSFDEFGTPSSESLHQFLRSRLGLMLPSEARGTLKDACEMIEEFNKLVANKNPKAFAEGEKQKFLEYPERIVINTLAYTTRPRYWLLGLPPSEEMLTKILNPPLRGEVVEKLGLS